MVERRRHDASSFPSCDAPHKFKVAGDKGPSKLDGELRRHIYPRAGLPVRVKIKLERYGETGFQNWYAVTRDGVAGWQAQKPAQYVSVPYVGSLNTFDSELTSDALMWPEGEKDVDTLTRLDVPAFTFGGTGDGLPGDIESYLKDRHLVILADNDQAGRDHAEKKAALAHSMGAASIKIVHFPELPEKNDVSDFIEGGGTAEQLVDRATKALLWRPDTSANNCESDAEPLQIDERSETDAKIKRLAKLPAIEYDRVRRSAAADLGVKVGTLDREVANHRATNEAAQDFLPHWTVAPFEEKVDGAALLDSLCQYLKRYVILPEHAAEALALWILHTWVFDCFDITPYLSITSPTKRCGKTLLMTLLYWLCSRAKKSDSMSRPAIYRSVDRDKPTLILDEVSWVLDLRDERQGILCGGFERNGYVEVCEGEGTAITTKLFSTYSPKAFGLIGRLTATLTDRSIVIPMRRKTPAEKAERMSRRDNDALRKFRQQCLRWANDNPAALAKAAPAVLDKLNDRAVDFWEPLLVIASQAGGEWRERAEQAALALSGDSAATGDEGEGVELLYDVKAAFDTSGQDAIFTKTLIALLAADEERPWATYGRAGKPITDRQVAKLLSPFEILSGTVRIGDATAKGYQRAHFAEAWRRYPKATKPLSRPKSTSQTSQRHNVDETCTSDNLSPVTETGCDAHEKCDLSNNDGHCDGVTVLNREKVEEEDRPRQCAQCKADDDGKLQFYSDAPDVPLGVWLHKECKPFYFGER
jgi:hypothetical protein